MSRLNFIKPYDDDKLHYNKDSGVYELTQEFVKKEYDNNWNDDKVIERRIKQNSRIVYDFIYSSGYSGNRRISKMLLNKTKEGRDFIFECLKAQYDADNENGYNDLSKQTPIDLVGGKNVNRDDIRANIISVGTEMIIDESSSYFGISIIYQGPYPYSYQLLFNSIGDY